MDSYDLFNAEPMKVLEYQAYFTIKYLWEATLDYINDYSLGGWFETYLESYFDLSPTRNL